MVNLLMTREQMIDEAVNAAASIHRCTARCLRDWPELLIDLEPTIKREFREIVARETRFAQRKEKWAARCCVEGLSY